MRILKRIWARFVLGMGIRNHPVDWELDDRLQSLATEVVDVKQDPDGFYVTVTFSTNAVMRCWIENRYYGFMDQGTITDDEVFKWKDGMPAADTMLTYRDIIFGKSNIRF